ncbi:splicing factor U2af large subunit A-like [Triticum dicoccoides]|uniref:splicing factor U2af large subunit A-like n=1 Tax=Triticum dicoccoides TaxID=85692 RepID=UPI00188F301A|nr:splicing factor U2af large subunit A-like [Triticum dicoccoides]
MDEHDAPSKTGAGATKFPPAKRGRDARSPQDAQPHKERSSSSRDRNRDRESIRERCDWRRDQERHHHEHGERSERREHPDCFDQHDYHGSCGPDAESKQVILSDAMKPSEAILVPAPAATPDQPHRLPAANPGMIPSNSKQVRLSDAMKPSEAILVPAPAATPGQPHRLPAANPGMIPSNSKQVRLSDAMKP